VRRPLAFLVLVLALAPPGSAQVPEVPVFGLGAFERGEPISITADALEARDDGSRRVIQFRRNVRVRQGALRLRTERLEAVYGAGAREPDSLSARGATRIEEGSRRALCSEVVYDRPGRTLVCRGEPAELWDGDDHIRGPEFHFDLADHRVEVRGGTHLEIQRAWLPESAEAEDELEALRGPGPVNVVSEHLEAREDGGDRTIRFSGAVAVTRGELSLRADELVLHFPEGAQQPERLVAQGEVVVREAAREARCARAEYRPGLRTVLCDGGARLRDGRDQLDSQTLHLDLGARRVDATGSAVLRMDPRDDEEAS